MSKWNIYTPDGMQDILFEDCYLKRELEEKIRGLFRSFAYKEVETPTIEFYDLFSSMGYNLRQEEMFKFTDRQGRLIVLRPDITVPVARVNETKNVNKDYPAKYSYIGNSFKANESGGGKLHEFTEAGVEVFGINSSEADAEVIYTAIRTVLLSGIADFQIEIGHVKFLEGILDDTDLSEEKREEIRGYITTKSYIAIDEFLKDNQLKDYVKNIISRIPYLSGGKEVLAELDLLPLKGRAKEALLELKELYSILADYGVEEYVTVDFGIVPRVDYYTGILFRGFTYGIGFQILQGGRYDTMSEQIGNSCPAVGFSIGINLLLMAMDRQKISGETLRIDTLVGYSPSYRNKAFSIAEKLRAQGIFVEIDIVKKEYEDLQKHAKDRGIGGLIYVDENGQIRTYNAITCDEEIYMDEGEFI